MDQSEHTKNEQPEKGRHPFATIRFIAFALVALVTLGGLSMAYQYYNCYLADSASIRSYTQSQYDAQKDYELGQAANKACAFEAGLSPLSGQEGTNARNYFLGTLVIDGIILGAYKFATKKKE